MINITLITEVIIKCLYFLTHNLKKFINAGKEKNKKKVICVETNQIFDSAKEASEFMGLYKGAVSNACIKNKPVGGYHWKYL